MAGVRGLALNALVFAVAGCNAILGVSEHVEVVCEVGADCASGFCTEEFECDDGQWALRFGGPGDDEAHDVVHFDPDREGDDPGVTIVVGSFEDEITFGEDHTYQSEGGRDAFVVAFNSRGETEWSRHFGGPGDQVATAIDVDPDGIAYVAGRFDGETDFGPVSRSAVPGLSEGFLVRLDEDGSVDWVFEFGGSEALGVADVAVTSFGIGVVGTFAGSFTEVESVPASDRDAGYWVSVDDAGALLFGIALPSTGRSSICCIDMADTLMVPIIAGGFTGTITSASGDITSVNDNDGWTVRPNLQADGTALLEFRYTGAPVHALEADGSRIVGAQSVAVGNFADQLVISLGDYLDLDDASAVLANDTTLQARVAGFARTGAGETYAVGSFSDELRFSEGPSFEADEQSLYLAFMNADFLLPSGRTRAFEGTGRAKPAGVALNGAGQVVLAGSFTKTLTLDNAEGAPELQSEDDLDIFVAQMNL